MLSPGVLGWASISRSHSSPAVSPLPTGAAARRDLCLDQAVVLIEDAIQVGGRALALGLVGAGQALALGLVGAGQALLRWPLHPCHPGAKLWLLGRTVVAPVLTGI